MVSDPTLTSRRHAESTVSRLGAFQYDFYSCISLLEVIFSLL